jgi:hypothetical protein
VNYNYCPLCASGQRYECLFYHPSVAAIFVDVVNSLDKSKREPELNNIEVQARIIHHLPALFGSLGYPCEIGDYGAVWSCIIDKLDQLFPYDCLLMINIPHYIRRHNEIFNYDVVDTPIEE